MHLSFSKVLAVVAGVLLIIVCINLWTLQEVQPYDTIEPHSSGNPAATDVSFTEQGNYVAGLSVRSFGSPSDSSVPVKVFFNVNQSRYHLDGVELRVIRQHAGETIYAKGYQKEFPARSWVGSDGYTSVIHLDTPGFWGESSQAFDFKVPRNTEPDSIALDLDARLSEKGPFWRHGRIHYHLPAAVNLTGRAME